MTSSCASELSSADSGFHFFQLSDLRSSNAGESCHSNEGSPLPRVKVTSGDGEEVGRNNKIWREKVDKETLAIIEVRLFVLLVEILILFIPQRLYLSKVFKTSNHLLSV